MTRHEEMRREAWIQGYQLNNHSGAKALEMFDADFPVDPDAKPVTVANRDRGNLDHKIGDEITMDGKCFEVIGIIGSGEFDRESKTFELIRRKDLEARPEQADIESGYSH